MKVPFAKKSVRDRNLQKTGRGKRCLLCDAPIGKPKFLICMRWDLEMIPADAEEGEESQGCFPVGSECIKKVPKKYRILEG